MIARLPTVQFRRARSNRSTARMGEWAAGVIQVPTEHNIAAGGLPSLQRGRTAHRRKSAAITAAHRQRHRCPSVAAYERRWICGGAWLPRNPPGTPPHLANSLHNLTIALCGLGRHDEELELRAEAAVRWRICLSSIPTNTKTPTGVREIGWHAASQSTDANRTQPDEPRRTLRTGWVLGCHRPIAQRRQERHSRVAIEEPPGHLILVRPRSCRESPAERTETQTETHNGNAG